MKQPTEKQVDNIRQILESSLEELIQNDSEIFHINIEIPQRISERERRLNRKLHETTINHRFAYYIENNLQGTDFEGYNVDIEYNRYYENQKRVDTDRGSIYARPDILIHSRMDNDREQHILVVEAKKEVISEHDISKVKGFISDSNYEYLFGLTLSYCESETHVIANLYYWNGEEIITTEINQEK